MANIDEVVANLESAKKSVLNTLSFVQAAHALGLVVGFEAASMGVNVEKIQTAGHETVKLESVCRALMVDIEGTQELWDIARTSGWL